MDWASTRPAAADSGTRSAPTGGVSARIRRASSAEMSLSDDGATFPLPLDLDRQDRAPARVPRDRLGLGGGEAPHQVPAQVVAVDDGVDVQVGGELEDVDVLPVLRAQLLDV